MRNNNKLKVLILQTRLATFRLPFYEKLGEKVILTVYYGNKSVNGISCAPPMASLVKYRRFSCFLLLGRLEWHPSMIFKILSYNFDALIVEGKTGFLSSYFFILIAKLRRSRIILWASGYENPNKHIIKFLKFKLESYWYKLIDHFIVYSNRGMDFLKKRGIASQHISIAYNSVDTNLINGLHTTYFTPEFRRNHRQRLVEQDEKDVTFILFVGRLIASKKLDILIEAFSHVIVKFVNCHLLIAGNGEFADNLKNMVRVKNISNVHFLGHIEDPIQLNTIFYISDIFVLPSLGGLALQQAAANGLPCIASVADGTENDIIAHGINGYIFEKDNTSSLENFLCKLLTDHALRTSMSFESRKIINSKINLDAMIETFYNCLTHNI